MAEMTIDLAQFALWLLTAAITALAGWLFRLEVRGQRQQIELAALRLHASETYATNAAVDKLSGKLDEALAILNRLVGRQEAASGG